MQVNEFKINQAVVAMDLSDSDNKLLEYLNFLNKEIQIGSLYFTHVIKKASFLSNLFSFGKESTLHSQFVLDEDIIKRFIADVEEKLDKHDAIHVEYDVREGTPLHDLIDIINEQHAGIVFIGKKLASESSGVLGRSIARRSPSSVWFVPQAAPMQIKTIVVPIDFSENSAKALKRAVELNYLKQKPAKIICAHIYEMPDLSVYKINKTYEQLKAIVEADMNEAFDLFIESCIPDLNDLIEKRVVERSNISTAGHLYEAVKEWEADLVIIGAKGHSPIERLLLGSVTEKFIQMNETIPTLITR